MGYAIGVPFFYLGGGTFLGVCVSAKQGGR